MDAATAIDKNAFVVCLCSGSDIVALLEGAIAFLFASIAYEWCTIDLLTDGLSEVRAGFKAFRGVLSADFLEAIEDHSLAFVKSRAQPVRASIVLVTVYAAVEQFTRDGRFRPSECFSDVCHAHLATEGELDAVSFVLSHVFHGFIPFCVRIRLSAPAERSVRVLKG